MHRLFLEYQLENDIAITFEVFNFTQGRKVEFSFKRSGLTAKQLKKEILRNGGSITGNCTGSAAYYKLQLWCEKYRACEKNFRVLLTASLIYSGTLWAAVMLAPQLFVGIFTPEVSMIEFASK